MTDTTTLPRSVVEQALEALKIGHESAHDCAETFHVEMAGYKQQRHEALDAEVKQISDAIGVLRAALDHPVEQEPVAWIENLGGGISYSAHHEAARKLPEGVRFDLYTHPQPQVEQEPVAEVTVSHVLPDLEGRCTAEIASRERLPVGAELFIHPQNLRCKSNQARLATLWGYVKPQPQVEQEPVAWMWEFKYDSGAAFSTKKPNIAISDGVEYVPLYTHPQPKREPLTDEQIRSMCKQTWLFETIKQWVRIVERAHGIGGEA